MGHYLDAKGAAQHYLGEGEQPEILLTDLCLKLSASIFTHQSFYSGQKNIFFNNLV
jgi:hypothetical protein